MALRCNPSRRRGCWFSWGLRESGLPGDCEGASSATRDAPTPEAGEAVAEVVWMMEWSGASFPLTPAPLCCF